MGYRAEQQREDRDPDGQQIPAGLRRASQGRQRRHRRAEHQRSIERQRTGVAQSQLHQPLVTVVAVSLPDSLAAQQTPQQGHARVRDKRQENEQRKP